MADNIVGTEQPRLASELCDLLRLGCSMIVAQLFIMIQGATFVFFAGQMGTAELAGVGLAIAFFNVTGLAMTMGLATASESLFSQAYGSPSHKQTVGVLLQRSSIFFLTAFLVVSSVNINSDVIFVALAQDRVVACVARRFLLALTPGLFALYAYRLLVVYLRVQDVYIPIVVSTGVGSVISVVAGYVAVFVLRRGVEAIALAGGLGYLAMDLALIAYITGSKLYRPTWTGWTWQAFDDWYYFTKLTGASIVLVVSEIVFGEMLMFLAGTLGPVKLSVQAVCFQMLLLVDMVHFGFSIACAIRVGTSLGANDTGRARRTVLQTLSLALVPLSVVVTTLLLCRRKLARLFSDDRETIDGIAETLVYCMAVTIVEAVFTNLNGAFRGCARQGVAGLVTFTTMYGLGVPTLLVLKFTGELTLASEWITFASTEVVLNIVLLIFLLRTNWSEQASLAAGRLDRSKRETLRTPDLEIESERRTLLMITTGGDTILGKSDRKALTDDVAASKRRPNRHIILKLLLIAALLIVSLSVSMASISGSFRFISSNASASQLNATVVDACKWLI